MSETYQHGPVRDYEITWTTGHVETVQAHQVSWPNQIALFRGETPGRERVRFHAEIDGTWTLVLDALVEDIRTIRDKATEVTT